MNNSLPRLIDGMVAALRSEIIPRIEGDFARGQAYGVIYMLNSLKLRASWSNGFLAEQLRALDDVSRALETLGADLPGAPLPDVRAPAALPEAATLEAERDRGDARIGDLIEWLAANAATLAPAPRAAAQAAIDRYLDRQARHEIATSARPMFREMSGGVEKT